MAGLNLGSDVKRIVWPTVVQGLGTGLVFTPMSVLAFATLAPNLRTHGTGVFTLVRNLGNSAGISIMEATFVRNTQIVHARLAGGISPENPNAVAALGGVKAMSSPATMAGLNGQVSAQAAMVSYIDVFHLMFLTTLAAIPLVLLLRKPTGPPAAEPVAAD